jgi:hypothetical protein
MECIIGLPVRNVEKYLKYIFRNILEIKNLFKNLVVYFFYDKSDDNTLALLISFKKDYGNDCHIYINNEPLNFFRTHRIAFARNNILQFIKKNKPKYFIMMDANDLNIYDIDVNVLQKVLNDNRWHGLSFARLNLPNGYYDIWALQYEPFIHNVWAFGDKSKQLVEVIKNDITQKLNRADDLFECYSSFNGFAIYRGNIFFQDETNCELNYDGHKQNYFSWKENQKRLNTINTNYSLSLVMYDFNENCEHLAFHYAASKKYGAKFFISKEKLFKTTTKPLYNIDFIWSKGVFLRNTYMLEDTETISDENTIIKQIETNDNFFGQHHIIWIRNTSGHYQPTQHSYTDLDIFAGNIGFINRPTILITSDGDRPVPSSYSIQTIKTILTNQYIIKWYTQNYDRTIEHPKLGHFPIGLDLHTSKTSIRCEPQLKINRYYELRNKQKIFNTIFCDSHLALSNIDRIEMHAKLKYNKEIYFLPAYVDWKNIVTYYSQYKFVLAPGGNGFDTHRIWELLLLGSIPITKSSPLDTMWIKNNLPVVIINDWDELNIDLDKKLVEWYNKLNELTKPENIEPKFKYEYWLNT